MDAACFGIDQRLLKKRNAVKIIRTAADKLEARISMLERTGSMENFWSTPIRYLKDGVETTEPFNPAAGRPYVSIAPIRPILDPGCEYPDALDDTRMKRAFIRYCDVLKSHGGTLPKFTSRLDKLRFNLRHLLTFWRII